MSITAIIEGVISREAGYVNNPHDTGGETNHGITIATARANGYTGTMRDMPRDVAAAIYLHRYVVAPGFHKIVAHNHKIGEKLVDAGVNCGPAWPSKWLQRSLNLFNKRGTLFPDLIVDGALGAKTEAALLHVLRQRGAGGERAILTALKCLQGAFYIDITEQRPENEEFIYGWLSNRVEI